MHSNGDGAFDVDRSIVDEQGLPRPEAEPIEGAKIDRRIGLQQFLLAGDENVAEAAEEGLFPRPEGPPEVGREIGDREKRHAASIQLLHKRVDAGDGIGDRLAEPLAPGRDQSGISREFLAELGRGLVEGPAAVQAVVPAPQIDILDEAQARRVVGDLALEEGFGIPAVKDVADVEDGGRDRGQAFSPGAP